MTSAAGLVQKENQQFQTNNSKDDFSFFDEEEWAADSQKLEKVGQKPPVRVVARLPEEEGESVLHTPSETPVSATTTERVTTTTTTTASTVKERPCICHIPLLPKGDCDGQLEKSQKNLEDTMDLLKVRFYVNHV